MPSPLVKSLSAKLNISVDKVEAAWKKAKIQAAAEKHKTVPELTGDDFKLVTHITKKMLGVKEQIDIRAFLTSSKSAKEFVEDMISTGAGIGHTLDTVVIPPKKPMAQPKDDEDEEDVGTVWEHPNTATKNPVKVRALGNTAKAVKPKNEKLDPYQNFSRIGMEDLSKVQVAPGGGFTETAQNQAGKLPMTAVQAAPIPQLNRARLDAAELKDLMNRPLATTESAMASAPFSIIADEERPKSPQPPQLDEQLESDLINDLMNISLDD